MFVQSLAAGLTPLQSSPGGLPGSRGQSADNSLHQQFLRFLEESIGEFEFARGGVRVNVKAASQDPAAGGDSRQFLVTLTPEPQPSASGKEAVPAVAPEDGAVGPGQAQAGGEEPFTPEWETMPGRNDRFYATLKTAQHLAARYGGEVVVREFEAIGPFPALPSWYEIQFPNGERLNAGLMATYYEPGRVQNPDMYAAAMMFSSGITNDFVLNNWSRIAGPEKPGEALPS